MVSKVPSALLEIEPNQDSTDLRRSQHLCSETAPLSFPAYLSKAVVEVSRKKFHCLPAQLSFSLTYHPWAQWKATTFSSTYNRTGEYAWQKRGDHMLPFFFFFPTTAFYSLNDLQPLLYAEQHSTMHCIYKTSNSSHFRALGFCSL